MDIKYGSPEAKMFVTNLSLITSKGKWGDNVMTAEWAHHISYEPGLVMINIHDFDATSDNILESKEFGVNLLSEDLRDAVGIAGGNSGKEVDKIAVLRDLGFKFYKGKKIGAQMLSGAALSLECKLIKHEKVGDHNMFIGEVLDANLGGKESVGFRAATGLYHVQDRIEHNKSPQMEEKIEQLVLKHRRG